ncbi:MAG: hypothetical protein M1833_002632 [Piccolia ochrophora]|nr:MAG: hypothetical protein M1833_002632 [Piccolia ochrophora]
MFYDLNIPWTPNDVQLPRTLSFLHELGYNVIALSHTISGKLPADLTNPIPSPLPFTPPLNLRILRRYTLIYSDPSQNHRLATLASNCDILAIRPTNERCLQQACQTLDASLISLDLTVRYPFHFKHSLLRAAINRGLRFEICYAPGVLATDATARRNLISNATQLIRATRGRGIVVSSDARSAVGVRAPIDVVNLGVTWGLKAERARGALENEARAVVVMAEVQRRSWKGVIDVVQGGDASLKRKAAPEGTSQDESTGAMSRSKSTIKRQAKKARVDAAKGQKAVGNVSIEPRAIPTSATSSVGKITNEKG